jgi:hypothetical protein
MPYIEPIIPAIINLLISGLSSRLQLYQSNNSLYSQKIINSLFTFNILKSIHLLHTPVSLLKLYPLYGIFHILWVNSLLIF